ncbi:DUF6457 domain-containing protein [Pseudonocardia sp. WMMC193]|uniref:DUF6457 domain-containing protein n=1 Tax=Pseudonocardia sp. WMMC193 TaxID=2911965 RepID=UPI001F32B571|nr:DUF6457 domain-containing protein [Pseudonocardia sp. WMMC193]MCF7547692.1 DUF6457 domain-containing protein [Pseudonocardia sp. WMMC193]
MSDDAKAMSEWVTAVTRELGIEVGGDAVVDTVLDLTSDVAHGVSRPAAPVTAFLIGIAAGRADDPSVAAADYARKIAALAQGWEADTERGVASNDQSQRA